MTQEVLAQKVSCSAALASPPTVSTPMFVVVLSEDRRTWYSDPLYAA